LGQRYRNVWTFLGNPGDIGVVRAILTTFIKKIKWFGMAKQFGTPPSFEGLMLRMLTSAPVSQVEWILKSSS
jgi:hypothetical protein